MDKMFYDIKELVEDKELVKFAIIEEFPEINYTLIYRNSKYLPWVAAWGYKGDGKSWGQGHYFENITDAMEYIREMKGCPNWYRMDEIANRAIDKIIENDPYDAEEFLNDELEIDFDEAEYFCLADRLDEAKHLREDDDYDI